MRGYLIFSALALPAFLLSVTLYGHFLMPVEYSLWLRHPYSFHPSLGLFFMGLVFGSVVQQAAFLFNLPKTSGNDPGASVAPVVVPCGPGPRSASKGN